ncbi:MAG: MazG nucleotide pyrophosphohydrolase domain-containing protein [Acidimicrobiales bacterium]
MIPRIDVVGLGPAGSELITPETLALMASGSPVYLRTRRHPAAAGFPRTPSFDHLYESRSTFDGVYRAIVSDLMDAAQHHGSVVYAVPGSPMVAERTVGLLGEHPSVVSGKVAFVVHPALSFLDLAFARLGVDPVSAGVRIVDAGSFAAAAAGERGPLLVAQCWSPAVLSEIKLSIEEPASPVTVLFHLGLTDERLWEVPWDEIDRSFDPDHLTSLWIPSLESPVASELVRLDELVRVLREQCPWDREQTHGSLARHLMEESYELLEAIDGLATVETAPRLRSEVGGSIDSEVEQRAVDLLEEELGDLLFQVYFHAALAREAGWFTLADVARGVHDKLVSRHPHVFDGETATGAEQMAARWEVRKRAEKNRRSVTDGIPVALPSLALAIKLQRKGIAVGMKLPGLEDETRGLLSCIAALTASGSTAEVEIGDLLFSLVNVARALGVDPESALRVRSAAFRRSVEALG